MPFPSGCFQRSDSNKILYKSSHHSWLDWESTKRKFDAMWDAMTIYSVSEMSPQCQCPHPTALFRRCQWSTGIHFTKCFWAHNPNLAKIQATLIFATMIQSGYIFAHVTTVRLSWHAQICELIGLSECLLKQRNFLQNFNFELIKSLWNCTPRALTIPKACLTLGTAPWCIYLRTISARENTTFAYWSRTILYFPLARMLGTTLNLENAKFISVKKCEVEVYIDNIQKKCNGFGESVVNSFKKFNKARSLL